MSNRILNCGGFIRRKSDEIDYKPCLGILYSDGSIKTKRLDTSRDKFHDPKTVREEMPFDMKGLIDELKELGEHGLNFKEEVLRHLEREKIDNETRKAVLEALEE